MPQSCGSPTTISCGAAAACGAPPFPPCNIPQGCGLTGRFACPQPPLLEFDTLRPGLAINIPNANSFSKRTFGVSFAAPSIPSLTAARACRQSASGEETFYECLADVALPNGYTLKKTCLNRADDPGEAYICSTGNQDLARTYHVVHELQRCAGKSRNTSSVAVCLGSQFLTQDQQYYLNCLISNDGNAAATVVCALAPKLTPEQQIGLNCAVSTGGEPRAFVACTAGRLTAREIGKCWDKGIGTDDGCFGPNNEIRQFADRMNQNAKSILGENHPVYQAFSLWQNNVGMPGPNNDMVRAMNNAIHDVQQGPGPSNDILRFGNQMGQVVNSVGDQIQCVFGCR